MLETIIPKRIANASSTIHMDLYPERSLFNEELVKTDGIVVWKKIEKSLAYAHVALARV